MVAVPPGVFDPSLVPALHAGHIELPEAGAARGIGILGVNRIPGSDRERGGARHTIDLAARSCSGSSSCHGHFHVVLAMEVRKLLGLALGRYRQLLNRILVCLGILPRVIYY